MKVLFIVEHFPSFSETFVLNQVVGLLKLGHEVEVYPLGRPSSPITHPDINTFSLLDLTWQRKEVPASKIERVIDVLKKIPQLYSRCGWRFLQAFNTFRQGKQSLNLSIAHSCLELLKHNYKYDLIQCHFGDKGLRALCWQEMGLINAPFTTVFHAHELAGLSEAEGRKLYGPLFEANALLLPVSNNWRNRLIGWGADPKRVIVHHMGVDVDGFDYNPSPPELDSTINILTVARLVEQKGYEYAIRAVAELKKICNRNIKYIIIGAGDNAGDLSSALQNLAKELGIDCIVNFLGAQPQNIVQAYMRSSHIFLHPSVTCTNGFQEGIPVSMMEAMSCGLPVISTIHSGIPELIENGISGFLANEREVEPLAIAMKDLIANKKLFLSVADAARKKVEIEFNIDTLNRQLVTIFNTEAHQFNN